MIKALLETLRADAYLTINKNLIKKIGLKETVLYSDLLSKSKYFMEKNISPGDREDNKGWFFNTIENIKRDTGLSPFQQREVIIRLIEKGLIEHKLQDMPAKGYFRIRTDNKALETLLGSQGVVTKETNEAVQRIFKVWNDNDIIHHNKIEPFKSAIEIALKKYEEREISLAIFNYRKILKDDDYYYTYRFTLGKFLRITAKTNLIEEFLDWDIAKQNYLKNKSQKPINEDGYFDLKR